MDDRIKEVEGALQQMKLDRYTLALKEERARTRYHALKNELRESREDV